MTSMTAEAATPTGEGELGDVEAPGHVAIHAGDLHAVGELRQVAGEADADQGQQDADPSVVLGAAFESFLDHVSAPQMM